MFLDNFKEKFELVSHGVRLPSFTLSDEDHKKYGISNGATNAEILRELCRHGYKEKLTKGLIPKGREKEYGERVKYELEVLEKTQFTDYILLVFSVISYAKKKDIAMGFGRGSGGGSLVNYLLDFVYSDPIKKGLFFERFVSEARSRTTYVDGIPYLDGSLICDLDLDFSDSGRKDIIHHLGEVYKGKFCKIATFSTLTTKILFKELCKIIGGMSEDESSIISDAIPSVFGKVYSPGKAREESPVFNDFCEKNPLIWETALTLHECIKNRGEHPSAYSISHDNLEEWCPVQMGSDGLISTFSMGDMSNLAIKLDLLGLRTLDLVYNTCARVGINILDIDVEDYDTIYKYLQDLICPYGLFQISGHGVVAALRKIKPKSLNQLSDVLAIARPGSNQFIDQYADYSNNGVAQSIHPYFDDILEDSGGLCLMQETQLAMVRKVGLDLNDAEIVRRCLGKKDTQKMESWKEKIYETGRSNKVPEDALDVLWKVLIDSSNYSFNKCIWDQEKVTLLNGSDIPLYKVHVGDKVKCFDTINHFDRYFEVKNIYKSRTKCYQIFVGGVPIICSENHKFLTLSGLNQYRMLEVKDFPVIPRRLQIITTEGPAWFEGMNEVGVRNTIDLEIDSADHNFYCNGIAVSNSHSMNYAVLSAMSVAVKHAHPKEFYVEALRAAFDKPDAYESIATIQQELPYFGIKLLPPDLVQSDMDFKIEGENLRFGLKAIKSVAEKSLSRLQSFLDKDKANKFQVFHAAVETKINAPILSALIQSGCLSSLISDRPRGVFEAQVWSKLNERERNYCLANGVKYGFDLIVALKDYLNWSDGGKRAFTESRLATIRKHTQPYMEIYSKNSKFPEFAAYMYEKQLLGYSPSSNLRKVFSHSQPDLKSCDEINNQLDVGNDYHLAAEVISAKRSISKAGNDMVTLEVSDETGIVRGRMLKEKVGLFLAENKLPAKGSIIGLVGKKNDGGVWIDKIIPYHEKIYFRVNDLKQKDEV